MVSLKAASPIKRDSSRMKNGAAMCSSSLKGTCAIETGIRVLSILRNYGRRTIPSWTSPLSRETLQLRYPAMESKFSLVFGYIKAWLSLSIVLILEDKYLITSLTSPKSSRVDSTLNVHGLYGYMS